MTDVPSAGAAGFTADGSPALVKIAEISVTARFSMIAKHPVRLSVPFPSRS
jgi:hypothetical protein